jgi:hypothetical protein
LRFLQQSKWNLYRFVNLFYFVLFFFCFTLFLFFFCFTLF